MVLVAWACMGTPLAAAAEVETEASGKATEHEAKAEQQGPGAPDDKGRMDDKKDDKHRPQTTPTGRTPSKSVPQDASAALIRATAAYEYGDMNQMVDAARPVAEGLLPATADQQAHAFRLLGIGLFLTNRPLGAETAFTELLHKDPQARLDPTTTRPEVVAFFESLRHQQLARQRSARRLYWNFLPPLGQFQNDDKVKGWVLLGAGLAAGITSATTTGVFLYEKWKSSNANASPEKRADAADAANTAKTVNIVSGAVLAAIYIYGVFDGLIGYSRPMEDSSPPPVSLHLFPGGGALGFTF
jgi:hypothetical protein